jgi:hypothetical protein
LNRKNGTRAAFLVAFVALASLPLPLSGQESGTSARGDGKARTTLTAAGRFTTLRSQSTFLMGAGARFRFGGPFSFGAQGWILADPLDMAMVGPGTGLRLKMAYGGLLTAWDVLRTSSTLTTAEVLWGAGNGKVQLAVGNAEIAADNFLVLEPGVRTEITLVSALRLTAGLSYRLVGGVEDLPGVGTDDLGGLGATLGLAIGPF